MKLLYSTVILVSVWDLQLYSSKYNTIYYSMKLLYCTVLLVSVWDLQLCSSTYNTIYSSMKLLYCTVVLVSVGSTLASGGYGGGHGGTFLIFLFTFINYDT